MITAFPFRSRRLQILHPGPALIMLSLVLADVTRSPLSASPWPQWRGPAGSGLAPEGDFPEHWDTQRNVRWRTSLPQPGNSTPVVWGDVVFVTQTAGDRRTLMCIDRRSGQLRWQQGPNAAGGELTHETNPYGSSSPATDGARVVAWFGSAGLFCYDFAGNELWHRELGPQRHIWGWGSSPIMSGGLCFLNFGPGEPSFLVAIDLETGREVWRRTEPHADSGEKKPGQEKPIWTGSWSTPIVIRNAGREELILSWPQRVIAFAPATGTELWSCGGLNLLVYASPLYDPDSGVVVAMGGYMGMALGVRAGGQGEVTPSRRLWHQARTKQRIGSGVTAGKHIYILNDPGIAECFELETGKLVWEERLKGPAAKSDSWSSMVLCGRKVYALNQGGDSFILEASPAFRVVATNSLGETTLSSPALSDGQIFVRTHEALWCLEKNAGQRR